ncbi:MAG: GNAT family N-acetyltransferase [Paracoccaceae bacterium]|nr:MAG: GNAT family N-acetyltransferase [Paracoccaceae bacterium]
MFPRANLSRHGLGPSDHPHATRFWCAAAPGGTVRAAVGLTGEGMILPQMADALPRDWADLRRALRGAGVSGAVWPAAPLRRVLRRLGLRAAATRHDADEPGMALDLATLRVPDGAGRLTPAAAADPAILMAWRADYHVELFGETAERAAARARRDIALYLGADSHRVLWQDGQPVAFTGFNAALPDIVQVGGVWVPPALRGRGLARRAVALHLAEARAAGVRRACLFAASAAAARAYRGIGFGEAAAMALVLFRQVERVA